MIKKLAVFILIAFCFLNKSSVFAQSSNNELNLIISPLPINLLATPGSSVSAQLKIKNNSNKAEKLQVNLMKFSAFGEEGKPKLLDREKGDDYFDWVNFSENKFDVAPGEWKTITMNISVPSSAAFGYYYAVTFSRQDEVIDEGARSTKFMGATAILVLLEVRVDNAKRDIEVLEFSTNKRVYEYLPANFTVKLRNKGNVHVYPVGSIFIDSKNKHDLGIITVNEYKGNVLPGTNRIFDAKWSDGFPYYDIQVEDKKTVIDKKGREIKKLKWDFSKISKIRIGKYTANLLLVYDNGVRDVPIEAKVSFWVIPWRMILITSLVVFSNIFFFAWIIWFIKNNSSPNKRRNSRRY